MPSSVDAAFDKQADVDRVFADYDRAELTVNPRPSCASRDRLLCVSCNGGPVVYNGTGAGDAGTSVCSSCGVVQPGYVIFETMFGRTITMRTSNYKRIHHWHERISQLMLMESRIPEEHLLAIGERILDGSHATINKDSIRAVLRSLGLQVYIEKWLQIIERCTGVVPPCPGPTVLQQLDTLFIELQRPFVAHKLKGRRNFLNYNYVFCRLLQQMNCTKFCMFFPLIRSKVKLRALDEMWVAMVKSVGWPAPPLVHVAPFAVRLVTPSALLQNLKVKLSLLIPAVPRTVTSKIEIHRWDHRPLAEILAYRSAQRSERPEPRPQTLKMRLKMKRSLMA